MMFFKRKLKSKVNKYLPPMSEEVRSEPIPSKPNEAITRDKGHFLQKLKQFVFGKGKFALGAVAACCIIAVAAVMLFNPSAPPVTAVADTAILLDVNPSVLFNVDDEGNVTDVIAVNADADVVISSGIADEVIGKPVAEAVSLVVDACAQLGYLELDEESCLKISGCGSEELISDTEVAVSSYLMSKGAYITVYSQVVEEEDILSHMDMPPLKKGESMHEVLSSVTESFIDRVLSQAQDVQMKLEEFYNILIPQEDIAENFRLELENARTTIEQIKGLIEGALELNNEIIESEDNPSHNPIAIARDYWALKNDTHDHTEQFTEEFGELMGEMDGIMESLRQHGIELRNSIDAEIKQLKYNDTLSLIDVFSDDAFIELVDSVIEVLEDLRVDISALRGLCSVPDSVDEFKKQIEDYANARINIYKDKYDKPRPPIGLDEYGAHIVGKIKNHGSIGAYWCSER